MLSGVVYHPIPSSRCSSLNFSSPINEMEKNAIFSIISRCRTEKKDSYRMKK